MIESQGSLLKYKKPQASQQSHSDGMDLKCNPRQVIHFGVQPLNLNMDQELAEDSPKLNAD